MTHRRVSLAGAMACAVLTCLLLCGTANARIAVGRSIGPVRLGQTKAQVHRELGAPYSNEAVGEGQRLWTYLPHGRRVRLFVDVTFGASGRVVMLSTADPHQRTALGIGTGSTLARLRRDYPELQCHFAPARTYDSACSLSSVTGAFTITTTFGLDARHRVGAVTISRLPTPPVPPAGAANPALVERPDGTAVLAWTQETSSGQSVWAALRAPRASAWSDVTELAAHTGVAHTIPDCPCLQPSGLTMAVGRDGTVAVGWSDGGMMVSVLPADGRNFDPATRIAGTSVEAIYPSLAVSASGTVTAMWHAFTSGGAGLRTWDPHTRAWGPLSSLPPPVAPIGNETVAPTGQVIVGRWAGPRYIAESAAPGADAWTLSTVFTIPPLVSPETSASASPLQLSTGGDGTVAALWTYKAFAGSTAAPANGLTVATQAADGTWTPVVLDSSSDTAFLRLATICSDRAGHFTVVADIPSGPSATGPGTLVAYTSGVGAQTWARATAVPMVPSAALVTSACGPAGEAVIVYQAPAPHGGASLYATTRGSLTSGWSTPILVGPVTMPVGWAGLSYPPQLAAVNGGTATIAWLGPSGVQTRQLP